MDAEVDQNEMTWVRVEEDAPLHPKFMQVGVAGFGFFVASLCYANHYLTDGLIPASALPAIFPSAPRRQQLALAEALVTAGLWERVEGGWRIHDFHDYQPSREAVVRSREERSAAKAAGGRARAATAIRCGGRFTSTNTSSPTSSPTSSAPADDQQPAGEVLVPAHQQSTSPVPVPVPEVELQTPNGVLSGTGARRPPPSRAAAVEVLEFLNAKTGRSYEARHPDGTPTANLRFIEARLKAGATVEDCKGVIARKVRQWLGDPKMAEYLRPKTLFNQTNFDTYLGERERDDA